MLWLLFIYWNLFMHKKNLSVGSNCFLYSPCILPNCTGTLCLAAWAFQIPCLLPLACCLWPGSWKGADWWALLGPKTSAMLFSVLWPLYPELGSWGHYKDGLSQAVSGSPHSCAPSSWHQDSKWAHGNTTQPARAGRWSPLFRCSLGFEMWLPPMSHGISYPRAEATSSKITCLLLPQVLRP